MTPYQTCGHRTAAGMIPTSSGGSYLAQVEINWRVLFSTIGISCMLLAVGTVSVASSQEESGVTFQVETIPPGALERAREAALVAPAPTGDWEANEKVTLSAGGKDDGTHTDASGSGFTDYDSCHYARGNTLILNVFIDHQGASWDSAERGAAGAKGQLAKEWYMANAPAGANLSFDGFETESYSYLTTYLDANIGPDGMDADVIEAVITGLGFDDQVGAPTNFDDFTLSFQYQAGGWDNVIAVFQPANVTGRAFAWIQYGVATLYVNSSSNVWRHEWGHNFGACDEYVEDGMCSGGVDCGPCSSSYLENVIYNSNCELNGCPSDASCVMRDNAETICDYTYNHWGWVDLDNNGQLDRVRRRVGPSDDVWIHELWHGGSAVTNGTVDGWVIGPRWKSWAVAGLRNPSDADYDLGMYQDNNHSHLRTFSTADGSVVDLVVADYNHSVLGNEHLQVLRDSGASSNYRVSWESGGHILYPNGLSVYEDWEAANVVRVWDVPLFAGESILFSANPGSSLDVGMMLFKSDGTDYFAGRHNAVWVADAVGGGAQETYLYTAPEDDVYGLVVYANNPVSTTLQMQVGPTPTILFEEQPVLESDAFHLYTLPLQADWCALAARDGVGADARFALFDDLTYQNLLVEVDDNDGVELAVGLLPVAGPGLVRAYKDGPSHSNYRMEMDLAQPSDGYNVSTWTSDQVVRVYPVSLDTGSTYLFREYQIDGSTTFDAGLHLFRTDQPEAYFSGSERVAGGNHRPAEDGEWMAYRNDDGGEHALAMTSESAEGTVAALWWGKVFQAPEDETRYEPGRVLFTQSDVQPGWMIAAARPNVEAGDVDVYLMNDATYEIELASSLTSLNVNFCVSRERGGLNHTIFPRFRGSDGREGYRWEWQSPDDAFDLANGLVDETRTWADSEVVETFTMEVAVAEGDEQTVFFGVDDISGQLDLGLMLYETQSQSFNGRWADGDKIANASGVGGSEGFECTFTDTTEVLLVVFNENSANGDYRLTIGDPVAADAPATVGLPERVTLELISPNPTRDGVNLQLGLPKSERVKVEIFDAMGRRVSELFNGDIEAGYHSLNWDGNNDRGVTVPTGVYFARVEGGERRAGVKLVKIR